MESSKREATLSSSSWLQLMGSNNWEGLLDPLDNNLRKLILRCGDFCQATYDAFNNDANSKYAGSSRYGKNSFFHKVMLESASDYQVEGFLYATAKVDAIKGLLLNSLSRDSWDRESNWIGYVASTTDPVSSSLGRREVYVVWRGTSRNYEWINVLEPKPVSAEPLLSKSSLQEEEDKASLGGGIISQIIQGLVNNGGGNDDDDDGSSSSSSSSSTDPKVMEGWLTLYISADPNSAFTKLSARQQLQAKIKELRNKYQDENVSITFTGHSLGATLSVLSAFDLVENGVNKDIPVSAIVFGSPQVGDHHFNQRLKTLQNLKVLHVRNKIDLLTLYPGLLLGYVDSGIDLVIDTRKSSYLKDSPNPSDWHNLQGMLHVVAGWVGKDDVEEFELKVERSLALVNKSSGFLREDLLVPESWWIEKNKGMVLLGNNNWVLAPPSHQDVPVPEYLLL